MRGAAKCALPTLPLSRYYATLFPICGSRCVRREPALPARIVRGILIVARGLIHRRKISLNGWFFNGRVSRELNKPRKTGVLVLDC